MNEFLRALALILLLPGTVLLAIVLLVLTAGISIVRYRNPDLFQRANPILYTAVYGISFGIALVLAFLGGVILYGF